MPRVKKCKADGIKHMQREKDLGSNNGLSKRQNNLQKERGEGTRRRAMEMKEKYRGPANSREITEGTGTGNGQKQIRG